MNVCLGDRSPRLTRIPPVPCCVCVQIMKAMRLQGLSVPHDYDVGYAQAKMTFAHQTVYDPRHVRACPKTTTPSPGGHTPLTQPCRVSSVCVHQQCLARVHPIPNNPSHGFDDIDFLGPWLADHIAHGIATGDLHPHTHQPFPANATQPPPPQAAKKQTKLPFLPIGDAPAPAPAPAPAAAAPAGAGGQAKGKNDHRQRPKGGVRNGVKGSSKGGASGKQPSILQWARKEDKKGGGGRDGKGEGDDCEITGGRRHGTDLCAPCIYRSLCLCVYRFRV